MQWCLFLQAQQALPEQVNVGFASTGTVPLINICLAPVTATVLGTGVLERINRRDVCGSMNLVSGAKRSQNRGQCAKLHMYEVT